MKAPKMPDKPSLDGLDAKWAARWEADGTYRFDRTRARDEVYSIDTPPPTVSGSLHVGHVFSFTQTDALARYQRMRGKAVFYPIGWDDNGLATERRVQNYFGVRCDPSQPFDPEFAPPDSPPDQAIPISRRNFVDLCYRLTEEDERAFEDLFRRLGLSFDWSYHYTTIGEASRRTSQAAFLKNLERGEAYRSDAPTLWDVDFRTAVAQAELEDRERPGAYHRLAFPRVGAEGAVEIETTRPELVPACVALVAHPSDERYAPLFGTEVTTPLFGVPVPVLAHHLADPEKGSGIAMVCTFGDLTDVLWWRELSLPTRTIVERDGRLGEAPFGEAGWESVDPTAARTAYAELEGLTVKRAQARIVERLREAGALIGEPTPITHPVKFYERGDRPLEIVSSKQWYVRTMRMRERLLERGRELHWVPHFMRVRYENWVEGLTGDWNISRQRFFGVPFPVWYRLDDEGEPIDDGLLLPAVDQLPIDPSSDVPDGYEEAQRGKPGGFAGDPDVMDTWATSSLTPQIAGGWVDDPDLFERVFPMDLRPQAHEIIRTWLFSTVVRAELESQALPWRAAAISGWILDPDRKKMSKSKGRAIVPTEPIEEHGTDAVRYWALSARLGVDTAYDTQQMKVGRRLAIKLLNATRFVLSRLGDADPGAPALLHPTDGALLAALGRLVSEATDAFERMDYARALELTETFFWGYCDDYLELVKARAYEEADSPGRASARYALVTSLEVQLRLFAPFLPFATEETWSWFHDTSIHTTAWPEAWELGQVGGAAPDEPGGDDNEGGGAIRGDARLLDLLAGSLGEVRRAKTEGKVSMRAPVASCVIRGTAEDVALLETASDDLRAAGVIDDLSFVVAGEEQAGVEVRLADPAA